MKKSLLIFCALCAVLVFAITSVAETVGGVHYRTRSNVSWSDVNVSTDVIATTKNWISDIETAYLYGTWQNIFLKLHGAPQAGDTKPFNIILSGDFDFKRTNNASDKQWFQAFGGYDVSSASQDTALIVTGNSKAKIDLDNGGIEFYGGNHCWSDDLTMKDSRVVLSGDSPIFTPDSDGDYALVIFGGSCVSNYGSNAAKSTSNTTGVTLAGPWNMADSKAAVSVGELYGGDSVLNKAASIIKDKSYVSLENDDCKVSSVYGGSNVNNSVSHLNGITELRLTKGSFERAVGGHYAHGGAKAYAADTSIIIGNIKALNDASVYGGGYAKSNSISIVSRDTNILIEPEACFSGRGGVRRIFGGSYSRENGVGEVLGSTNIIISGDAALDVIKPRSENGWTHISPGGYLKDNTVVSNDVKGDGSITLKNIADISKLMNNTVLDGQGRVYDETLPGKLGFYNNSVVGTSRLIYDNVKGVTGARTYQFDEIIFKNSSAVTVNRSLSQLDTTSEDMETAALIVESGSTLHIAKDPTGDTGNPVLGNAKIDGKLVIEKGVTLILNNSLEKGKNATIEGSIVVKKNNTVEPPVIPDNKNVIPVTAEKVTAIDSLPNGVPALVAKQPNGEIIVTSSKFISAVEASSLNGKIDTNLIKSLPVIKTTAISKDQTAVIAFKIGLDEFAGKKFSEFTLCKVIPDKVLAFKFQKDPSKISSGEFSITDTDGIAVSPDNVPSIGNDYVINFAVEDKSDYDLDNTAGTILDPAVLTVNKATEPAANGGSSGCNAGFAALALLAVLPALCRRKK